MNLFSFSRLFGRKPPVKPATMRSNDDFPSSRPVRELRGDVLITLDDYRPKKREPAEPASEAFFLISLPREKQLRLARLLRPGYLGYINYSRAAAMPTTSLPAAAEVRAGR